MFKKKVKDDEIIIPKTINIQAFNCPHCGKIIVNGELQDVELLTKWKDQD